MRLESNRVDPRQFSFETYKGPLKKSIDRLIPGIPRVDNSEAVNAAKELLPNHSLLIALNHPSYIDTFLATHTLLSALEVDIKTHVNILMSEALARKNSTNPKAIFTQQLCKLWDINTLPVFLSKKGWNTSERSQNNRQAIIAAMHALRQPNNIVIIFPEGNINASLQEVERGLGEFIVHSNGYTLPVTSNFHSYLYEPVLGEMPKPLVVHYPLSNAELSTRAQNDGKIASKLVMTTIASALPEYQRGFYSEMGETPEKVASTGH